MRAAIARLTARPIAHRGLHGCGHSGPLENTLPAAEGAIAAGYGIECDVRFAADGTPVVIHDATLRRLAGRPEAVAELDVPALATVTLTGGAAIPTLAALLAAVGGRVALVVEIKPMADATLADRVLDLVAAYTGPIALESFDAGIVERCRQAPCPVGLVGPGDDAVRPEDVSRCDFISWDVRRLDDRPIGLPTTTWTVRTPDDVAAARAAEAQVVFEGFRP